MASNPRIVTNSFTLTWDGVQTPVAAGTIVDIPAGSALETAYGLSNLASMTAAQASGDAGGGDQVDADSVTGGGADS